MHYDLTDLLLHNRLTVRIVHIFLFPVMIWHCVAVIVSCPCGGECPSGSVCVLHAGIARRHCTRCVHHMKEQSH
jgi:hypothetical protein